MRSHRIVRKVAGWRGAAGVWGVLAGAVGSLCCVGPSAAILLGLGSSSALFGLHLNQTLAFAVGIAILGVGSVLAWRRSRACALPKRASWRQVVLMLGTGALVYGVLGVVAPWAAERQESAPVAAAAPVVPAASLRRATVLVEKMDCPPCVTHMRALLARKPFVVRSTVEASNDEVVIVYNAAEMSSAKLVASLPTVYRAELHSDAPLP